MKIRIILSSCLLFLTLSLPAQTPVQDSCFVRTDKAAATQDICRTDGGRLYFFLHGGMAASLSENWFSYKNNGASGKLLDPQGNVSIGYDFPRYFGLRLNTSFGNNHSAANTRDTSGGGFYPYSFKSVNVFADAVFRINYRKDRCKLEKEGGEFLPKIYVGLGCAHTFGFSNPGHPWQVISGRNTVLGARLGTILEYDFTKHFGLVFDLALEFYGDNYNGLKGANNTDEIPFDLRIPASIGLAFSFPRK